MSPVVLSYPSSQGNNLCKKLILFVAGALICVLSFGQQTIRFIKPLDQKFIDTSYIDKTGRQIIRVVIPGSPPPKIGYNKTSASISNNAVMLDNVPAFSWTFGCTATSAAMIAGYYDRNGYANIYTGPSNNGLCPLDNSAWGSININNEIRDICPLSATMKNVDGRTTRGHVEDYWIQYGNNQSDPYITNGWQQHKYEDCTADYMKTNQSAFGNSDGATTYYFYSNGDPFGENENRDGIWGFQQFLESRGYQTVKRYTQTIQGYNGNSTGYTFADYKSEIDGGRPVMVHVQGHTMIGVGYDNDNQSIYLHNTWDYSVHSMIWGGEYEGMQMISMSVFELQPVSGCISPVALKTINITNSSAELEWNELGDNSSWEIEYGIAGFIRGQGTFVTVSGEKKLSLSNLLPDTKYFWYIRTNCQEGNSEWTGPAEFSTFKLPGLQLVSKSPLGTNVEPDCGLQLLFNKQVKFGAGKIRVYKADGTIWEEILATSCLCSGTNVTIPRLFDINTNYYVLIDNNAFFDDSDVPFAGLSNPSDWTFSIGGDKLYCQIFDLDGNFLPNASVYYSNYQSVITNNSGMANISSYGDTGDLIIVHEGLHYLIKKNNITTPASIIIRLAQEALTDLTITGKDDLGNVLPDSRIYIEPDNFGIVPRIGITDSQGILSCKVSKVMISQIQLCNWPSQYLLRSTNIDCSGGLLSYSTDLDASKMSICKINPQFTGEFSSKSILISLDYWGFIFQMEVPTITVSEGLPIYYGAWLYKDNDNYELDFDGVNSPLNDPSNSTQTSYTIFFDDKLKLKIDPEKETYNPGEIVRLKNQVLDSYKNMANWAGNYSANAADQKNNIVKLIKNKENKPVCVNKQNLDSLNTGYLVYPQITVTDPNGIQIISYSGWSSWNNYEFTLPTSSIDGDYIIDYSLDFGPWADKLSVKDTIKVQVTAPIVLSFYPESNSTANEPDCIPTITFNTVVETGTGMISIYKTDGTLYSQLPASACVIEGTNVRIPRLLDVNSSFYILTDEDAFLNSKGKVAPINDPAFWTFATAGNTVYCQVFDLEGFPVSETDIRYYRPDWGSYYASTNDYGIARLWNTMTIEMKGSLLVNAYSKGYIIQRSDVSGISASIVKLSEEPTITLSIQSKDKDDLANNYSNVYIDFLTGSIEYCGSTDNQGNLSLKISPVNIPYISLLNWDKRLVLSTTGIDCTIGENSYIHQVNATELGLAEIKPKLNLTSADNFATYYGHRIAPLLYGEDPIWISTNFPIFSGTYFDKTQPGTSNTWTFHSSPESQYMTLVPGSLKEVFWGDSFSLSAKSEKSSYTQGEIVRLSNKISDFYSNYLNSVYNDLNAAPSNSTTSRESVLEYSLATDSTNVIRIAGQSNAGPDKAQTNAYLYPTITVTSPNGTRLIEYTGSNAWMNYQFTLPIDAVEGKYYIDYTVNSGPLAELMASRDSFMVGIDTPVLISLYPASQSTGNEPDCIPTITFNTPVQTGTGMISIYKTDGTLYCQLPASACIVEGTNVRIPRLLDVNSSFYILTDEDAFLNSKGTVAPINDPAFWTFATAGNTVYCQVFDLDGFPVFGTNIRFYRPDWGAYSASTNDYGIAKLWNTMTIEMKGSLLVSAYSKGYMILRSDVSGISASIVKLGEEPTITLSIQSKDKDDLANNYSSVNIDFLTGSTEYCGSTDNQGNLSLKISPVNIPYVSLLNWDKRLVLSTTGIDCTTGENSYIHQVNATELGLAEIKPKLNLSSADNFATYYGHRIAPHLYGEDPIWISTNFPIFSGAYFDKTQPGTTNTWTFRSSPESQYMTLNPGSLKELFWGDSFFLSAKSEKSSYTQGEIVRLSNKISDFYSNYLNSVYNNLNAAPSNSTTSRESVLEYSLATDPANVIRIAGQSNAGPDKAQTNAYLYPTITVTSPNGTKLIEYTGYNAWINYQFNLPIDAVEGKYYIDYTINSGPLAGLMASRDSFMVGVDPALLDKYEPDNTIAQASTITSGVIQQHSIYPVGDVDYASFELTNAPSVVNIQFITESGSRQIQVIAPDGTTVLTQDDEQSYLTLKQNGKYYIRAWNPDNQLTESYQLSLNISPVILISSIILTEGAITTDNGTLQMVADILPANATNKALKWAVENVTGRATIDSNGLLTALLNGTVIIKASAKDDSGVTAAVMVTISGQIVQITDLDIIKNGNFIVDGGIPAPWGFWSANGGIAPTVVNGVAVCSPIASSNVWEYLFFQSELTALPNIPYVFSFKAWSDENRSIMVDFQDTPENNYNRYGTSTDPEALSGNSEWTLNLTTTPTTYTFHVVFDKMIESTVQYIQFMLNATSDVVYLDQVSLISEADLLLADSPIANAGSDQPYAVSKIIYLTEKEKIAIGVPIDMIAQVLERDVNMALLAYKPLNSVADAISPTATLDGSLSSDPQGNQLTYRWTAPEGITLSSTTVAKPTFIVPQVSENTMYTFTLVVNNGEKDSPPSNVTVTSRYLGIFNQHFTPIWTGNGIDHENINIYSAKMDGIELETGDEIGIFDGNICVGVGTLTGPITSTNTLDIAVSKNDGTGNGYTPGNAITFKLYNKSKDLENSNVFAIYDNTDSSWSTNGKFTIGATAFVELTGFTKVNQDIAMNTGWNIISANVVPANMNLKDIFQSLIDAGKLKKVMDETGKTIENYGAFGGWKNNIGNLNSTKGYKVNVTASTLSLEGTPVQLPLDIDLSTGWNIISYPSASTQDAKALVQTLIDAGKLKKVMDESGKTIENFGAFGGWKNNIGNFLSGKGYKVNVTESCTLNIPATGTKSAVIVPEVLTSIHFTNIFKGNGTDHMSINLVNLKASGLQASDEIGVFDGENCVGSATIGTEQLMAGSISIPVSANDELGLEANGFTQGNPVKLQLYRKGQTYQLNSTKLSGNEMFEKNGSLFAQVNADVLTAIQIIANSADFRCFPNPFTREITIEVKNTKQKEVTVEIYNLSGQHIKNLYKGTDDVNLVLKWDGTNDSGKQLAPGVYLCKVNGQSKQVIFEGGK